MRIKSVLFAFAMLLAGVTVVSAQDANMGTWKLNEAKSRIAKGAAKNHTVVYESAGELDMTKVIVDGTGADGSPTHNEWTGKFNGVYYPVTGDANSDSRMYARVNSRTLSITAKKDGKVTMTGRITVSRDGKSRTVSTRALNAQGKWITNTSVYDKQ